jgi:hypothetical protein
VNEISMVILLIKEVLEVVEGYQDIISCSSIRIRKKPA